MSIENIVSSGLVSAAAMTVAKTAHNFIAAITGHPGEDLPTVVGEWAKEYLANLETVTNRSRLILLGLDREPRVDTPLKILKPIFEGASAEGDPTLQERWANLLANAIDPDNPCPVQPIFPFILRDLGGMEVKFIDSLYERSVTTMREGSWFQRVSQVMYSQTQLMNLFFDLEFSAVRITPSVGFQVQQTQEYARGQNAFFLMMDLIRRHDVIRETVLPKDYDGSGFTPGERVHHFTELGVAFVEACRPPQK